MADFFCKQYGTKYRFSLKSRPMTKIYFSLFLCAELQNGLTQFKSGFADDNRFIF